jgi:uncharacterized protein YndB with AHSA1/START domain
MATVEASALVSSSLADTWDAYFDPDGWRAWVDGFEAVIAAEGFPQAGGTLRWRSTPAGRGEVTERVLEHEPRRRHRIEFQDSATRGELEVAFAIEGAGTRVRQALTYRLTQRGPIAMLASVLFVRSQMRRSLERSLGAFREIVEHPAN